MRKIVWLLAQITWLVVCILSLIEAYKGYRGISDWQTEEGLGFEMLVLSFPASFVIVALFMVAGMLLRLFGLALPASSKSEMVTTWLAFVVAGYIQWFVVVPKVPKWMRRASQKHPPDAGANQR